MKEKTWHYHLAKAFIDNFEDDIKERYIQIRRKRLGSIFPMELLEDMQLLTSFHHLRALIGPLDYEKIREYTAELVEEIMNEVEGII